MQVHWRQFWAQNKPRKARVVGTYHKKVDFPHPPLVFCKSVFGFVQLIVPQCLKPILKRLGVFVYEVQKLLGHSSVKVTEVYSHLAASELHIAVNKISLTLN